MLCINGYIEGKLMVKTDIFLCIVFNGMSHATYIPMGYIIPLPSYVIY